MGIKSVYQLQEKLDNNWAWRKKEIINLISLTKLSQDITQNTNIRSGIVLVYAHWEGYIKQSSEYYLQFITSQNIQMKKFTPNFIAGAMRNAIVDCGRTRKVSKHTKLIEQLMKKMDEPIKIPYKSLITTQSNLSSKVLFEILLTLDLDPSPYELKFKLIDNHLLDQRNKVSHGQYLDIDLEIFLNTTKDIIFLLETFRNQLIESAKSEKYLENN